MEVYKKFNRLKNKQKLYLILLLTVIVHTSYIFNSFSWLDHGDIESGRTIIEISQFYKAFITTFGGTNFFRPLITLFNSIDHWLYEDLSFGYHVTNITLHLCVTWISFHFLKIYFNLGQKQSLLGSLIVGIHPLSWLPVGAISYRSELLATFFTLSSLVYYIKLEEKNLKTWLLFFVLTSLAFFSKETSLFWIPLLILLWEVQRGELKISRTKNFLSFAIRKLALLMTPLSVYLFLRIVSVGVIWSNDSRKLNLSQWIGTRIVSIAKQIIWLFSPFKPGLSDATRIYSITDAAPFSIFILSVVLLLLVRKRFSEKKVSPRIYKVLGFFVIALFPALNILPLPRFTSPHYSYFAVVGVGGLITFFHLESRFNRSILVIWLIIAAFTTFRSGFLFKDDKTLFSYETAIDNHFLEGHYYLGNYYLRKSEYAKAEYEYEAILNSSSDYIGYFDIPSFYVNYAAVRLAYGNYQKAKEMLYKSIEAGYEDIGVYYNLALVEREEGNYAEVVELLAPYKDQWKRPEPLLLLAEAYLKQGKEEEARQIGNILEGF